MALLYCVAEATGVLSTHVTADLVKGVLDEIIGLLPVILPASIGFIGIRKGLSFVFRSLKSA